MSSLVRFFTGRKSAGDLTDDLLHELQPFFPNCGRLLPPATPTAGAAAAAAAVAQAQAAAGAAGTPPGAAGAGAAGGPVPALSIDGKSAPGSGAAAGGVAGGAAGGAGAGAGGAAPAVPHLVPATPHAAAGAGFGAGAPPTPSNRAAAMAAAEHMAEVQGDAVAHAATAGAAMGSNGREMDEKTIRAMTATLAEIKVMLYGDGETEAKPENVKKILDDLMANELLMVILAHMKRLEFEARKDVAAIYTCALKNRKDEMIAYFMRHPDILTILVTGYGNGDVALQCGIILRDALRHEVLLSALLAQQPLVDAFFGYVQLPTFDISSDAFATFKTMLTRHKSVCSKYLEKNFDWFFARYRQLLESQNYVVKRQSLKLLGEMLMNRNFYGMMIRYVTSADHLKCILGVLRSNTKAVQIEAFHVFKIFIANPNKSQPVIKILLTNRDKLAKFIAEFTTEQTDPAALQNFNDEKQILLQSLAQLNASMLTPAGPAPGGAAAAAATPAAAAGAAPAPAPPGGPTAVKAAPAAAVAPPAAKH